MNNTYVNFQKTFFSVTYAPSGVTGVKAQGYTSIRHKLCGKSFMRLATVVQHPYLVRYYIFNGTARFLHFH